MFRKLDLPKSVLLIIHQMKTYQTFCITREFTITEFYVCFENLFCDQQIITVKQYEVFEQISRLLSISSRTISIYRFNLDIFKKIHVKYVIKYMRLLKN